MDQLISLTNPFKLLPTKMGANWLTCEPSHVVKSIEGNDFAFIDPSYGPPRHNAIRFWDVGLFQNLFITRIIGPSCFYVQEAKELVPLRKMVKEMTEWYDNYWSTADILKKSDILIGGFYVAYQETYHEWYRCRVEEFIEVQNGEMPQLIVTLLDYGTTTIAQMDQIFQMRAKDLLIPIKAVMAHLYDENERRIYSEEEVAQFQEDVGGEVIKTFVYKSFVSPDKVFPQLLVAFVLNSTSSEPR